MQDSNGNTPLQNKIILAALSDIDVTYSYDFRACIYNLSQITSGMVKCYRRIR
jgi:hypothetical protein